MDDPISALDASVRKQIIEKVILGKLKNKTRVLVTHAIDFVNFADSIIIMDKGRIVAKGSFKDLKDNEAFQNLLKINHLNKGEKDGEQYTKVEKTIEKELTYHEKLEKFEKLGKVTKEDDGKIISDENDEKIKITWKTYKKVLDYAGGWNRLIFLNITLIAKTYCETMLSYKLGEWAHNELL